MSRFIGPVFTPGARQKMTDSEGTPEALLLYEIQRPV